MWCLLAAHRIVVPFSQSETKCCATCSVLQVVDAGFSKLGVKQQSQIWLQVRRMALRESPVFPAHCPASGAHSCRGSCASKVYSALCVHAPQAHTVSLQHVAFTDLTPRLLPSVAHMPRRPSSSFTSLQQLRLQLSASPSHNW